MVPRYYHSLALLQTRPPHEVVLMRQFWPSTLTWIRFYADSSDYAAISKIKHLTLSGKYYELVFENYDVTFSLLLR